MSTVERGESSSMGTTREPPSIGIRAVRQDTATQFPEELAIQALHVCNGHFGCMLLHLIDFMQTGPYGITTRWTMVMTFVLLPWNPQLVFTGISVMGVNPKSQKFCSHVDLWDSIENNDYFSFEGFLDILKQYDPFVVAETKGEKLSGSSGFNDVAGYIFGKNSTNEKIPMTTPVFTQAVNDKLSEVSIQIVLPMNKELENLPSPAIEAVKLRKVEGGIAAVMKFSGKPTEEVVFNKEKELRSALLKAGLKPREGCMLARYNDPGRTWSFIMRNEVLIWLDDFTLE